MKLKTSSVKKPARPAPAKAKPKPMKQSKQMKSIADKLKAPAIQKMVKSFEKKFGTSQIAGFMRPMAPLEVVKTGLTELDDIILSCGGVPRGRIGEIFGPESGGKTTLTLAIIAAYQRKQLTTGFVDMEHSMDPEYAAANGVDVNQWLYCKPLNGEECVEMIIMLLDAGIDLVVVDSWGALFPKDAVDKDIDKAVRLGGRANLIGRCVQNCLEPLHRNNNTLIAINQLRENIGAMAFQSKTKTPGGWEVRHAYAFRIKVSKGTKIRDPKSGAVRGIEAHLYSEKSKVCLAYQHAKIELVLGQGISKECSVIDEALRRGVLEKSGSWISFGEERLANSRENARKFLVDRPDIMAMIEEKLESLGDEPDPDDSEHVVEDELEGLGDFTLPEGGLDE